MIERKRHKLQVLHSLECGRCLAVCAYFYGYVTLFSAYYKNTRPTKQLFPNTHPCRQNNCRMGLICLYFEIKYNEIWSLRSVIPVIVSNLPGHPRMYTVPYLWKTFGKTSLAQVKVSVHQLKAGLYSAFSSCFSFTLIWIFRFFSRKASKSQFTVAQLMLISLKDKMINTHHM